MSRLGQGDLRFRNQRLGTVWVSRMAADSALQPRIKLTAGCQVQDLSPTEGFPEGVAGFTIAALGGQLRWREKTGPVVGDLSIPKGLQYFRSANHPHEHKFTMCCDVPRHVLSRLEAERGAAAPIFWMDLAGSWALDGSILRCRRVAPCSEARRESSARGQLPQCCPQTGVERPTQSS